MGSLGLYNVQDFATVLWMSPVVLACVPVRVCVCLCLCVCLCFRGCMTLDTISLWPCLLMGRGLCDIPDTNTHINSEWVHIHKSLQKASVRIAVCVMYGPLWRRAAAEGRKKDFRGWYHTHTPRHKEMGCYRRRVSSWWGHLFSLHLSVSQPAGICLILVSFSIPCYCPFPLSLSISLHPTSPTLFLSFLPCVDKGGSVAQLGLSSSNLGLLSSLFLTKPFLRRYDATAGTYEEIRSTMWEETRDQTSPREPKQRCSLTLRHTRVCVTQTLCKGGLGDGHRQATVGAQRTTASIRVILSKRNSWGSNESILFRETFM